MPTLLLQVVVSLALNYCYRPNIVLIIADLELRLTDTTFARFYPSFLSIRYRNCFSIDDVMLKCPLTVLYEEYSLYTEREINTNPFLSQNSPVRSIYIMSLATTVIYCTPPPVWRPSLFTQYIWTIQRVEWYNFIATFDILCESDLKGPKSTPS